MYPYKKEDWTLLTEIETLDNYRARLHFSSLDSLGEQRKFSTRRGVFTLVFLSLSLSSESDKRLGQRRFLVHVTHSTSTPLLITVRTSEPWALRASERIRRRAIHDRLTNGCKPFDKLECECSDESECAVAFDWLTPRRHSIVPVAIDKAVLSNTTRYISVLIDRHSIWNQESAVRSRHSHLLRRQDQSSSIAIDRDIARLILSSLDYRLNLSFKIRNI